MPKEVKCCKTPKQPEPIRKPEKSTFYHRQAKFESLDDERPPDAAVVQKEKRIQAYFSKFPCIKTCMTKIDVSQKGPSRDSRRIDFEKVEDDFAT